MSYFLNALIGVSKSLLISIVVGILLDKSWGGFYALPLASLLILS